MNFERQGLLDDLKRQLNEYVPPFEDLDKRRSISPSRKAAPVSRS